MGSGKMTYNMGKAKKFTQTAQGTLEDSTKVLNKASVNFIGQMVRYLKEILTIIK